MRKNKNNETDLPLTISSKDGLVDQVTFFNKTVASKDMSGYYLLKKGEYAYNKSYSVGYDFGSIKRLEHYPMGALSTLYICFALTKYHSDYIKTYFDSLKWYKEIYMISAEGARNHGLLNVPTDEFFSTYHYITENIKEQEKIAKLMELIELRIKKQQGLVDNLKKYKRGVSNKLFTDIQSDANNHTYRFSDVFKILQNNTLSRDMLCTEKTKVLNIHYGDVLIKYNAVTNIETTEIPYIKENIDLSKFSPISYLESGDVVFADTAEDYTVGKATEIQSENKVFVLSGLHTIPCRPIIKFHKGYLGHYFNSSAYRTDILPLTQGTKVSSISKTELLRTSVIVPPLEQQQKVSDLLSALDNKIDRLELEVYELMQLKAGLLQQLFI